MWIAICSFLFVCEYLFLYDIVTYELSGGDCYVLIKDRTGNALLWLVSRGVQDVFWVWPIVYVFWHKQIPLKSLIEAHKQQLV